MKLKKEQLVKLYTNLVRARKLDELIVNGMAEGKVGFYHSGQGEEAVAVGGCTFLNKDDYIYAHHRSQGSAHAISKGVSAGRFVAEFYGKATGTCCGLSSFHVADPEVGVFGIGGTIGSAFPLSLGWGLAAKKKGKKQVVVCFFGDGSSNRGTFHEAMNMAAMWKLPIVWVCANNGIAQFMPIKDAYPKENIADLAYGYGIPGVVVDGQDVIAVHEAVQAAVERARAGQGPTLIECKTFRYRSHVEGMPDISHAELRPAEEIEAWKKKDPIKLFAAKLLEQGVLTQADIVRIDKEAEAEMKEADRFAMESPVPEPSFMAKALYSDLEGGAR